MSPHKDDTWADAWHWMAVYDDDSSIAEYDDDSRARGFLELEQSLLKHFVLVSQREGLPDHALTRTNPESRVVFFRRRQITANAVTGEEVSRAPVIHCLGLECGDTAHYTFFFEDGSVLVSDNRDAV